MTALAQLSVPAKTRDQPLRAAAAERHLAVQRAQSTVSTGELTYLHEQVEVAAAVTTRLAVASTIEEMLAVVIDELRNTRREDAVIERLEDPPGLRLAAGIGPRAAGVDGFLVLEEPFGRPEADPRSRVSVPIVVGDEIWGILSVETRPGENLSHADMALFEAIAASLALALQRTGPRGGGERPDTSLRLSAIRAIAVGDADAAVPAGGVANLARRVAIRMGLSSAHVRDVHYAALLHDVGTVGVPSEILRKPGPLEEAEWGLMRRHSVLGADLLTRIEAFRHLAPIVRATHERWDGGGYPDGIGGEEIPLAARIIAACATYDAIVTARPYRRARNPEEARVEMQRVSGTQLDRRIVGALMDVRRSARVCPL